MLRFYFDHNMQRQIASGLRLRDVDVLTAYEDNAHTLSDLEILNRASALSRVLVTKDHHFLGIAHSRLEGGIDFTGIVYISRESISIGDCIEQLEIVAKVYDYTETINRVLYLPI